MHPSTTLAAIDPIGNGLLAAVPLRARGRLVSALQMVTLQPGTVLGPETPHAHFPLGCVLALSVVSRAGDQVGAVLVGPEGLVGIEHVLGSRPHATQAVALLGGTALRVVGALLAEECRREPELQRVALAYAGRLLAAMAQRALCYRRHSPDEQLCGLLVALQSLSGRDELPLTHETLASVLGLRRETISQAAMRVQAAGYVRYGRGHIQVVDRAALVRAACDCQERWAA